MEASQAPQLDPAGPPPHIHPQACPADRLSTARPLELRAAQDGPPWLAGWWGQQGGSSGQSPSPTALAGAPSLGRLPGLWMKVYCQAVQPLPGARRALGSPLHPLGLSSTSAHQARLCE